MAEQNAFATNKREDRQQVLFEALLNNMSGELREITEDFLALLDQPDGLERRVKKDSVLDRIGALPAADKFVLCDAVGLATQLRRSASISAAHAPEDGYNASGLGKANEDLVRAVARMKEANLTVEKAQEALQAVAFDQVFTAHPTYIGDLEYTKALRNLDLQMLSGDKDKITEAVEKLSSMPTVVEGRMKVQDEVQLMRHFLGNTYRSVPKLYGQLDNAFADQFGKTGQAYDPLKTHLNLTFQSWGSSGDKDGNNNVNYHTTEDAVKTHRKTIVHFYQGDLQKIIAHLEEADKATADALTEEWIGLHAQLDDISQNTMALSESQISRALEGMKTFTEKWYQAFSEAPQHAELAKQMLGLRRNLDVFGLGLGQIECREDAGQLKLVIDRVLREQGMDAYARKDEASRESIVDELLEKASTESGLESLVTAKDRALLKVPRYAKTRQFNYEDSGVGKDNFGIFYHTMKRLDLAYRNPDMFKSHVLAEAETPLQFKEMLLLLKLSGNDHNMRIVPLFENPSELAGVGEVMKRVQDDPAVYKYLLDVGINEWNEKASKGLVEPLSADAKNAIRDLEPGNEAAREQVNALLPEGVSVEDVVVTQVQLAHSDNSRRGGVPSARAAVYKAHESLRQAAKDSGMGMQFFEGGSHTDSFRMGTRSYRSMVNTYNTHNFMKSTVQGMDLAQIFSNPLTIQDFIGENIANAVSRNLSKEKQDAHATDISAEGKILAPFIDAMDGYQQRYFGSHAGPDGEMDNRLGYVMEQVFDYSFNKSCGTIASRSAGRKKEAKGEDANVAPIYMDPVKGTRTIGYSEALQHAGINPNFIGIGHGEYAVRDKLHEVLNAEYPQAGGSHVAAITGNSGSEAARLNLLYHQELDQRDNNAIPQSKAFRDIMDRIAYGVAMTDMDMVWERAQNNWDTGQQRTIQFREEDQARYGKSETVERPHGKQALEAAEKSDNQPITGFLAGLELEYREAAVFAYQAITGEELERADDLTTTELRDKVRTVLPIYKDHFGMADIGLAVANKIEQTTSKDEMKQAYSKTGGELNVVNGLGKALHALRDQLTLVRPPFRSEARNRDLVQEHSADKGIV